MGTWSYSHISNMEKWSGSIRTLVSLGRHTYKQKASRSGKEGCIVLGEENVGRGRQKGRKELVAQLYPALCDPMDCSLPGSSIHGDSPGKNTGVGCHSLLQGIFLTKGLNLGLLNCRQILYHLSHQEEDALFTYLPEIWAVYLRSERST